MSTDDKASPVEGTVRLPDYYLLSKEERTRAIQSGYDSYLGKEAEANPFAVFSKQFDEWERLHNLAFEDYENQDYGI